MMKQTVKQHHDHGVTDWAGPVARFLLIALAMLFSTWGTVAAQGSRLGLAQGAPGIRWRCGHAEGD